MSKQFDPAGGDAAETVVGPSVKIQGDLNSEGNIRIEGQVSGKVKTTQSVQISEGAKITADVLAGNAVVAGEVQGNFKVTNNLILQPTARITGDISCAILRVEDGAQFSGKCTMGSGSGAAPQGGANGKTKNRDIEPEIEE